MKTIFTFVLFTLVTTIGFTQNENSYEETLKTMFELSGAKEAYGAAIEQTLNIYRQNSDLDSEIWDELEAEFMKASINDLVELLVPVYQKHLTKEDLEGIIAFYRSPAGKKLSEKTPLITQESMMVGQEWGRQIGEKLTKKLEERGY